VGSHKAILPVLSHYLEQQRGRASASCRSKKSAAHRLRAKWQSPDHAAQLMSHKNGRTGRPFDGLSNPSGLQRGNA
jgi:hypothetical protein